jgi:hypothetical protein
VGGIKMKKEKKDMAKEKKDMAIDIYVVCFLTMIAGLGMIHVLIGYFEWSVIPALMVIFIICSLIAIMLDRDFAIVREHRLTKKTQKKSVK